MSITATAQVIRSFGDETRFESADLDMPDRPAASNVRVRVAAISVNPVDLSTRAGKNIPVDQARFPMVLGWDVAGTVTDVGGDVTGVSIGDRVAAMSFQPADQNGTYRSVIDLDASLVSLIPDALDLTIAATLPLVGLTASGLLHASGVEKGDLLLVNGPLGAVGRLLVQLAAASGVQVAGLVALERAEEARELGLSIFVPRGSDSAAILDALPRPADAAIDLVGGATAHATLAAVRDGGAYETAVPPYIDAHGPFEPERGIDVRVFTVAPDRSRLDTVLDRAAKGSIVSPIDRRMPLADVAEAHRLQKAGRLAGKIVLVP